MSGAKVYTVNGAAPGAATSLPDWLTRRRAQKAKGRRGAVKEELQGAINVVQDFEFPEASYRIKVTRDGHHALATGTYKPQLKCFDLDQLSQKFERHSDAENVDFVLLTDDWTKSVHLQADRTLELHTQSAAHYKTRIPRFGRAIGYHFPSCDAIVGAAGRDVYRLNLDQGRFMTPLVLEQDGCNALDVNPAHNLLSFGTDAGTVEFWDPRARDRLAVLQLDAACTALASRSDGLSLAVGTHAGLALVYDLRSPRPLARKDQGYGLPVHRVAWLERVPGAGALLASADRKVLKLWDRDAPAANFASITPAADINDVHHLPGTGMLMTANEGIPMHAYYVPALGPAPRWCAFLDSLTEELEDTTAAGATVYEDFRFLDRAELARLGLDALLGTPALRPYMHGFFVKQALYDAARVIADPFVYEDARRKKVQEKLDKLADSRIRATKKAGAPKVNAALADRVRADEERAERKRKRREERAEPVSKAPDAAATSLLADPRFSAVFENPEFAVDEESREYQLLNPSAAAQKRRKLMHGGNSDDENDSNSEEEEDAADRPRSGLFDSESDPSGSSAGEDSDGGEEDAQETRSSSSKTRRQKAAPPPSRGPKMVALQADRSGAGAGGYSRASERTAAFGQRRHQHQKQSQQRGDGHGGNMVVKGRPDGPQEISWVPSPSSTQSKSRQERSTERERGGKKVERFGAGMERGGGDRYRDGKEEKEADRRGRTHRRTGIRSGSRNAFRRL